MSLSLDKNDIVKVVKKASSLSELEAIRVQYLGKKGTITEAMKSLSLLPIEEKKEKDKLYNSIKTFLENELSIKKMILKIMQ